MDNLTPWKEALKERTLYGCFVTYGLPDIAEVTALMGFDFLLLDNEHGVIEQSTLADMVRASQLRGVPAVVRCTMKEYDHIQKALDFGANGVQLPLVNTAEDARRVVELANYAPQGRRGTAYLPRAARYGMVEDKRAYLRQANDTKLVCCQVETRQAVENLDGILEVDGVDVYFIGPGDLAASYGEPAGSPKMLELTERMIRRIVAAGKTAGYYVGTPEAARQAEEWGARYLVTAVNQYMVSGGRSFLSQVRGGGRWPPPPRTEEAPMEDMHLILRLARGEGPHLPAPVRADSQPVRHCHLPLSSAPGAGVGPGGGAAPEGADRGPRPEV